MVKKFHPDGKVWRCRLLVWGRLNNGTGLQTLVCFSKLNNAVLLYDVRGFTGGVSDVPKDRYRADGVRPMWWEC